MRYCKLDPQITTLNYLILKNYTGNRIINLVVVSQEDFLPYCNIIHLIVNR